MTKTKRQNLVKGSIKRRRSNRPTISKSKKCHIDSPSEKKNTKRQNTGQESSTRKRSNRPTISKSTKRQPGFPSRTSPNSLFNLISKLNSSQKNVIHKIGFGSLLDLKINKCSFKLCKYLVESFNYGSCTFFLENGARLLVNEVDVHRVLNIPMGKQEVCEKSNDKEVDKMIHHWKARWGSKLPSNAQLGKNLEKRDDFGDEFIRDFMILVMSSFIWGTKNSQCRTKVLHSLLHTSDIPKYNWCEYTVKALAESCRDWMESTCSTFFFGPQTFMMLLYLDRTSFMHQERPNERRFPVISNWNMEQVLSRINLEEKTGHFGNVRVIPRIELSNDNGYDVDTVKGDNEGSRDMKGQIVAELRPKGSSSRIKKCAERLRRKKGEVPSAPAITAPASQPSASDRATSSKRKRVSSPTRSPGTSPVSPRLVMPGSTSVPSSAQAAPDTSTSEPAMERRTFVEFHEVQDSFNYLNFQRRVMAGDLTEEAFVDPSAAKMFTLLRQQFMLNLEKFDNFTEVTAKLEMRVTLEELRKENQALKDELTSLRESSEQARKAFMKTISDLTDDVNIRIKLQQETDEKHKKELFELRSKWNDNLQRELETARAEAEAACLGAESARKDLEVAQSKLEAMGMKLEQAQQGVGLDLAMLVESDSLAPMRETWEEVVLEDTRAAILRVYPDLDLSFLDGGLPQSDEQLQAPPRASDANSGR